MKIREARSGELAAIIGIYADAREFMRASGNMDQWRPGYPGAAMLADDIERGELFVCEGERGEILGVFFYRIGNDKTYEKIYEGEWINDEPYGVIHRIAVAKDAHGRGVAGFCFDYALGRCPNLKIDTHRDNIPMQKALAKYGFTRCGTIYLENGEDRIAFQKGNKS